MVVFTKKDLKQNSSVGVHREVQGFNHCFVLLMNHFPIELPERGKQGLVLFVREIPAGGVNSKEVPHLDPSLSPSSREGGKRRNRWRIPLIVGFHGRLKHWLQWFAG